MTPHGLAFANSSSGVKLAGSNWVSRSRPDRGYRTLSGVQTWTWASMYSPAPSGATLDSPGAVTADCIFNQAAIATSHSRRVQIEPFIVPPGITAKRAGMRKHNSEQILYAIRIQASYASSSTMAGNRGTRLKATVKTEAGKGVESETPHCLAFAISSSGVKLAGSNWISLSHPDRGFRSSSNFHTRTWTSMFSACSVRCHARFSRRSHSRSHIQPGCNRHEPLSSCPDRTRFIVPPEISVSRAVMRQPNSHANIVCNTYPGKLCFLVYHGRPQRDETESNAHACG